MESVCKKANDTDSRSVLAAVALLEGVFDGSTNPLAVAAKVADVKEEAFAALLAHADFVACVEAEQVKRRANGDEVRSKAAGGVVKAVDRVKAMLDDDSLSTGTVIKAGEFLHKVSGLGDAYSAELRKVAPDEDRARVFILRPGDKQPDTSAYKHALIIDLRGHGAGEKVVDGESREVGDE